MSEFGWFGIRNILNNKREHWEQSHTVWNKLRAPGRISHCIFSIICLNNYHPSTGTGSPGNQGTDSTAAQTTTTTTAQTTTAGSATMWTKSQIIFNAFFVLLIISLIDISF